MTNPSFSSASFSDKRSPVVGNPPFEDSSDQESKHLKSRRPISTLASGCLAVESEQIAAQTLIRRWVWKMAIATLALMAVGSATRVMNAGLACPDWPLCYGQLVPTQQMNLRVFLEWFHRLDASLIGLMAIGLLGLSLWKRLLLPTWLPWATLGTLFLIVVQGVLGGLTVIELLRFDIVTAHLGTALLFFCSLLIIGMSLLPYKPSGNVGKLPWLGLVAALLVYVQSLIGGLVGSRWAAHQCFGVADLCNVMNTHILGVVPPTLAVVVLVISVWRTPALDAWLRRLASASGLLVILQIALGVATFKLRLQVEPLTVCHQAIGAALLGSLVAFTVLSFRDLKIHKTTSQSAAVPPLPASTTPSAS